MTFGTTLVITIMVVIFNDILGALYGTLIPHLLLTSVHCTAVKEFKVLSVKAPLGSSFLNPRIIERLKS